MQVSHSHAPAAGASASPGQATPPLPGQTDSQNLVLEDEVDVSSYLRALRHYWRLLVAGVAIGAIIGLTLALRRPTLYEAATSILASQTSSQVNLSTSRALLRNNTLAEQTLHETGLDKPPFNLTPQAFVGDALEIEDVVGTTLVRVKVRLQDPVKAAEASRILARKSVLLNRQLADTESTALRTELQGHVDTAAGRLKESEQRLLAFRNSANLEVLRRDTSSMLDQRGDLLRLLIAIEAEKARLAAAEQEIQKHERVLSVPRVVSSEQPLRAALPDAPTSEALDQSHPFINPIHQTLALQIATSRTRLAALERERREKLVVHKLGENGFSKLAQLHQRELELARLEADYELAKRVHAELALRHEQSRTESVNRMVQLQVVDEAIPPDRPLPKKPLESMALGSAVGLLLAVLATFIQTSGVRASDSARRR